MTYRTAKIKRGESTDQGTFGVLTTDSGYSCVTGELPDRGNATGRSRILPGIYKVTWRLSPKHGMCWHVENVPGRTDVEIHAANLMGDVTKGWISQLEGCIAPGKTVSLFPPGHPAGINSQMGVTSSHTTLAELVNDLGEVEFYLTIV